MKDYLTTGEAAGLLNLSRSTVSRKYDLGILRGKTNPITGERLISRESVEALLKQYNLPADHLPPGKKTVILCSADVSFVAQIQDSFSHDDRIGFQPCNFATDALVACSKAAHELLIIDEEVSDMPFAEMIKYLRRSEYTKKIPILVCCTKTGRAKCLELGADEAVPRDLLESGAFTTSLYSLLQLEKEPELEQSKYEHRRQWPRIPVNLPATVFVYPTSAPRRRDQGEAQVENISRGGVLLSHIKLQSGSIPLEPFRILVMMDKPPLENFRAHCQLVRLQSVGTLTAALQFVKISKPDLTKIIALSAT